MITTQHRIEDTGNSQLVQPGRDPTRMTPMATTNDDLRQQRAERWGPILVFGFGIAVAMWGLGYFGRLPTIMLPAPLLLFGLVLCPVGAGAWMRRFPGMKAMTALQAGIVAGVVNLLVLGSFIFEARGSGVPSPAIWVPGAVVATGLLALAGYQFGRILPSASSPVRSWTSTFAWVAASATLLLLAAGGIVTTKEAGLAVVDWPNSFRYNMFLYPFSKMTGPVFYEHAHRLLGALVGLTTLALAIFVALVERRKWVRRFAFGALLLVIVQGILGGLRVTGKFTLSDDPSHTTPRVALAALHGVMAQVYLAMLVALTTFTSALWQSGQKPVERSSARGDRVLAIHVVTVVVVQLVLGAVQRHYGTLLWFHIIWGVAVVTPMVIHAGMSNWGRSESGTVVGRLGLLLTLSIPMQLILGMAAYVVTRVLTSTDGGGAELLFATAHQWFGAWVLGLAVLLLCWNYRLVRPPRDV